MVGNKWLASDQVLMASLVYQAVALDMDSPGDGYNEGFETCSEDLR